MSPRIPARLLARQPDARLLKLVAQGHERAFDAIVLRYRAPLLGYCARLGLSHARAEDAVQQSLLKAWLALQGGAEVENLSPWLYRIVHNTAVNALRSAPPGRLVELDESMQSELGAPEGEHEQRASVRDTLRSVAELPPMQRSAILMSAVDGRSHAEVASALGVSDVAVRGLIYRARASLRAAAASIAPTPLLSWLSQAMGRVGTDGGEIAQLAGSGGGDLGGALAKGVALAVAAALAAGAVIVPLRAHRAHHAVSALAPKHASADTTGLSGSSRGSDGRTVTVPFAAAVVHQRAHGTGLARAGDSNSAPSGHSSYVLVPEAIRTLHPHGQAQSAPSATKPSSGQGTPSVQLGASRTSTSPSTTAAATVADTSVASGSSGTSSNGPISSGGSSEVASGGSEGTSGRTPPPPPGTGGEGHQGPEDESEAAEEQHEREAEAAREAKEREAETKRETAEREAEREGEGAQKDH